MNLVNFPRRNYITEATPIEFLPNFSKALGNKVNVYIKRDDLLPGCAGGNKTRKLEYCIADALEQGADSLITCGAVQSNHARLTLSWAVKEGLECHFVLEERVQDSYKKDASGNNFLYQLLGVDSIRVVPGGSPMLEEMEKLAEELRSKGKKPYIIPGGASNAIGSLGYAACAQEINMQLYNHRLHIDTIVVPSGSGGTHAGMVVGMSALNNNIPIIGINVSRTKEVQEKLIGDLADKTADKMQLKSGVSHSAICCFGDYVGEGYSLPTDGMIEAVKLLATTESILLDPVYTGKEMAGFIDLVRKDYFPKNSNILFLHTGGSPALYAYLDIFR